MDANLTVAALKKLTDHVASGIGSVAGSMLAPWRASRDARAKLIAATADARVLQIHAEAQAKARAALLPRDASVAATIDIADRISQRVRFQEGKRQANIESVVLHAAEALGDRKVTDSEPDHDWAARYVRWQDWTEDVVVVNRRSGESMFERLDSDALRDWLKEYSLGQLWKAEVVGGGPAR